MNKNDFITQAKSHTPSDDETNKLKLGSIGSFKKLSCYQRALEIYQELIQATIAKSELIVNAKFWFCQEKCIFKYFIISIGVEKVTTQQKNVSNPFADVKKAYKQFFGGKNDDGIFGLFSDKSNKK